jgi:hypothetical protein
MHDFKHLSTRNIQGQIARHTKPALKPDQKNWQDGWDYTLGDRLVDLLIAGTAAFFMIAGVLFVVTQIAIRGLA